MNELYSVHTRGKDRTGKEIIHKEGPFVLDAAIRQRREQATTFRTENVWIEVEALK